MTADRREYRSDRSGRGAPCRMNLRPSALICGCLILLIVATPRVADAQWKRHAIDDSSRGADGVRLADVNGDGLQDITTGWEEGGVIRVYLNPGHAKAREKWPAVTVGKVKSAEDAVFADLDGDGATDVVSCCEGGTQCVFVHWAPRDRAKYLDETAWTTAEIPVTKKMTRWMFALPMQVDGKAGVDIVVASKQPNAVVGWLRSPVDGDARDLSKWTFHKMQDAGWVMSLRAVDMDNDGDLDVIVSDRKGSKRGVYWLGNPGADATTLTEAWKRWPLCGADREVMFIDVVANREPAVNVPDLPPTPVTNTVFVPTRDGVIITAALDFQHGHPHDGPTIDNPFGVQHGKGIAVGDIDLDGVPDLVHTTNTGSSKLAHKKPGVAWIKPIITDGQFAWRYFDISGLEGVKFDRIELLDLDGDGDLDVITCEERDNLGVIWYENPTR